MKAILCESFAPVEQLRLADVAEPQVKPGQALLQVCAASVNYPDGLIVQGLYQAKPELPFIPGSEVAGEVLAVGEGVNSVRVGDRVAGFCTLGGFAERVAVDESALLKLDDSISDQEASGLFTAYATAHHGLKQRGNLQPGETLVVTGAAGGTGLAAVQIGKAMGAKVIAVCSSEDKLATARDHGADVLINSSTDDLKTALKQATGGRGVDVAYDAVGGAAFAALARCMAWNGRLLVVGFASGQIPSLPVNLALVKGYSVIGVFWGSFTRHEPETFQDNMREMLDWYRAGKVKVLVDDVVPLDSTAEAIQKVMSRQVKGKLVIKP
ncbi:NADPH:quinone oxidoreductase family protein [Vibrio sp.]|uniref:NADPH:quinone oxidoreductase family protein n=1 Tax=Vibrio sp. TaxID=678 RepID=UPI003D0E1AC6